MNDYFQKLLDKLELTPVQKDDAKTKYGGVCKAVHDYFYDCEYDGSTKFLFGSYRKKTNIRPLVPEQDVDVLVKLPYEVYERYDAHAGNGQSELLRKIRDILSEKYVTTDNIKSWGKVVLVEFSNGTHNVELLPAFENEDRTFTIPNTSDGGSWETFDPRTELDRFRESNNDTGGLTRELSKLAKRWARENAGLSVKSYRLEEHVVDFLAANGYGETDYALIVRDFFSFLVDEIDGRDSSYAKTALGRSEKALEYMLDDRYESAVEEWRKVFGGAFPSTLSVYSKVQKSVSAEGEQFIEDLVTGIDLDPAYRLKLDCSVQIDGFRSGLLSEVLSRGGRLNKKAELKFRLVECNVPHPFTVKWKVRNFGKEAEDKGQLRGEITNDDGSWIKKETTQYKGDHIVECYIVKGGVCVATESIEVPID